MIHNHHNNDRNNIFPSESGVIPLIYNIYIFFATNRYHITAFGSAAAVFKLNISVGREVSALRQIKSFKRCRKGRRKRRGAERSEAMRGFHLKKRVVSERKHLNRSVLDIRSLVLSGINEESGRIPSRLVGGRGGIKEEGRIETLIACILDLIDPIVSAIGRLRSRSKPGPRVFISSIRSDTKETRGDS